MIQRINNPLDIVFFLQENKDKFNDFYLTQEKSRRFLNEKSVALKAIKKYQVFGSFSSELDGLFIIIDEKGFRRYLKILVKNNKIVDDLLKFINWNFAEKDLYIKIKKDSNMLDMLKKNYYQIIGDRGREFLLVHNKRDIRKLIPKDLGD